MTKRLFIAIPYVPKQEILGVIHLLKTGSIHDKINWVPTGNMHLTLKFIGDTDISDIPKIRSGLSEISKTYSGFELKVIGFEMFFRGKHPSVIYLNLETSEIADRLAKDVSGFCERMLIGEKGNSFKAHITVARIKYMTLTDKFKNTLNTKFSYLFTVNNFELIESQLTSTGPIYRVEERFVLNA